MEKNTDKNKHYNADQKNIVQDHHMIQRQTFQRNQVDHIPVQVRIGFADKKSVSAVYGKNCL